MGTDQAVLSQVDALSEATVSSTERGLLTQLYRRLLERPGGSEGCGGAGADRESRSAPDAGLLCRLRKPPSAR